MKFELNVDSINVQTPLKVCHTLPSLELFIFLFPAPGALDHVAILKKQRIGLNSWDMHLEN